MPNGPSSSRPSGASTSGTAADPAGDGHPGPPPPDPLGLVSRAEGAIIGTVVSAAVIAYGVGKFETTLGLVLAILATVAVYWLAHLHAVTLAESLTHAHHPLRAFKAAAAETWPVAGAAVVPIAVLAVATLLGADQSTAAWWALGATVLLLAGYSHLAARRGGMGPWGQALGALVGALLGVLVALLKVALH